jgi:glycolate oxidase
VGVFSRVTPDDLERLRAIAGAEHVLTEGIEPYGHDETEDFWFPPEVVVRPRGAKEVSQVLRLAHERRIPVTPQAARTGLSGGALPVHGGIALSVERMNRILEIDAENRYAVVEPGLVNVRLTAAVEPVGLHYAPDPSSQTACTLGGNVAENSGGPHCLKYGVTSDHVLGMEVVLPDGEVARLGGPLADLPGPDLVALFVGAEGTFGVVTEVTVRLTANPHAVRTFLAIFDSMALACRTVADITRTGVLPVALEILDQRTIRAVEASVNRAGYPESAAAVLLIELDGFEAGMDEEEEVIRRIVAENRAIELRSARDPAERAQLWKGRKAAFGAMGRVNTDLYVLDGVVPRTRLEKTLERVYEIADRHRVTVSNVFHAGDGNLHPNISYDGRDEEETARVLAAGREMLQACVDAGGSISGEHGIGLEKMEFMPMLFSDDDLDLQAAVRDAIDPARLANPGKILPGRRAERARVGA